jgi:hypothetical protein
MRSIFRFVSVCVCRAAATFAYGLVGFLLVRSFISLYDLLADNVDIGTPTIQPNVWQMVGMIFPHILQPQSSQFHSNHTVRTGSED